ncbi:unnamed protein product [Lupinus luteus]|uniref:beta-galactosidase n=1 Tax=Lupinus luteus TaxID=3873 RepID=A0AAV1X8F8_LUPLU
MVMKILWCYLAILLTVSFGIVQGSNNVTYDGRSLIIDGNHRILFSGSIHYPRSTPEFDFSGRRDLVRFIKEIQKKGLYVTLRIGPFIESEWTYGGLPLWLSHIPGIVFRTDNEPFKINTCNGKRCGRTFKGPNSPNKPSLWTEDWTSFYQAFGEEPPHRSVEDIAFHVALFVAKNGSYVNYYMYHGGTNFDRTASAFVTTAYYDESPLDEYGLVSQPLWGHLKKLHAAIKSCSKTLLHETQTTFSLGKKQEVRTKNNTRVRKSRLNFSSSEKWKMYEEAIPNYDNTSLKANTLLNQISTTNDTSDYLWYTLSLLASSSVQSVLSVLSRGHVLHAFVNGVLVGSAHGSKKNPDFDLESNITFISGINKISLLSATVGMPNSGAYLERKVAGLHGVKINGTNLTNQSWGYQVGLLGEKLQIYTDIRSKKVQWNSLGSTTKPLTWYQATFDAPKGHNPVALNLGSMGKGEAWINGQSIGRYWVSFHTPSGIPSQQWYHIPRSLLKRSGNLLVLFEEETGNPLGITLDTVHIRSTIKRHG